MMNLIKLKTDSLALLVLCLLCVAFAAPSLVRAQDTHEVRNARSGAARSKPAVNNNRTLPPGTKFDLDLFEANVRKAFDGKAIGYSYAINQGGQFKRSGANGYAILARDVDGILVDPLGVKQHEQLRMNIASVSKPLTAVTVLRLLQENKVPGYPNLTINSKVAPFLPSTWKMGEGVADLTFKDFLSQYTGMTVGGATGTAAMKTWIAAGTPRAITDYEYINANLAIFRIIIPYMMMSQRLRDNYSKLSDTDFADFENQMSNQYVEAVQTKTLIRWAYSTLTPSLTATP
jgi:CubicO group peptidase (beta-lactamase class C family)